MEQNTKPVTKDARGADFTALLAVGLGMVGIIVVEGQVLPHVEGSAEPSLLGSGPWAWPFLQTIWPSDGTAVSVFLGIALLVCLGAAYAAGLAVGRSDNGQVRALMLVLIVTALLNGLLVASLPARQADLFYYAFQGRMVARAHLNPYVLPPRALAPDAWFPFVSRVWRDLPTGYGPVWLLVSAGVDALVDRGGALSDFVRTIVALRALFAASSVLNALLIWLLLADLAPERRLLGAIAYAWNPAVLLTGVDHNDGVMLLFALTGLWLHTRRKHSLAVVALTLSALVKYFTAPLLLGYLLWRWQATAEPRVGRYAAPVIAAALSLLVLVPFDPPAIAAHLPAYLQGSGRLDHVERVPFEVLAILGAVLGIQVASLQGVSRLERVIEIAGLALFGYLAFLSRDWFPWYLISALGLSALLGGWWLDAAAMAGATWMLNAHDGIAYVTGLFQQALGLSTQMSVTLLAFAPALLFTVANTLRRQLRISARPVVVGGLILLTGITTAVELPLIGHWNERPREATLGGGRAPGAEIVDTTLEWDDWSRNTIVDQIETPAGPEGSRSVCLTFSSANAAFFAHHPGISTHDYDVLRFYVGPPGAPPPALIVELKGSNGQALGSVALDRYLASAPVVDGWRRISLPLSRLGAAGVTVGGLVFKPGSSSIGKSFCLQDLAFR